MFVTLRKSFHNIKFSKNYLIKNFLPWESRFNSSSLILSVDESFIANNSCLIWLWLERISSEFFLWTRFFLIWLLESIAAAAISADERFFDRIISFVSTPIDEVKEDGGFNGVAFSIEIFDNDLWRDLRIRLPFDDESNCS